MEKGPKKPSPGILLYFCFMILFTAATFSYSPYLAAAEATIIVLLALYAHVTERRRRAELVKYIETITYSMDSATRSSLNSCPLPTAIFRLENNEIIWTNKDFVAIAGDRPHIYSGRALEKISGFSLSWLQEGKYQSPGLMEIGGRSYEVFGSLIRTEETGHHGYMAVTYWVDVTMYAQAKEELEEKRPVVAVIVIDNYEELCSGINDSAKSAMIAAVDSIVSDWAEESGGFFSKYHRDRYIFIFENQYLDTYITGKFSVLDRVREVDNKKGMSVSLSIGLGKDGESLAQNYQYALLGMDMALSRGGDQAVIKDRYNFAFYGGHSNMVERRTKVKSRVLANTLGILLKDSSRIFVMGHKYADLDCLGGAVGICCAARKLGKEAKIVIDREKNYSKMIIDRISGLPEYQNAFVTPQEALLQADGKSLLIVVDTNRPEQVESEDLLASINQVAVIDHHRRAATYIDNAVLSFHEPYASSTSELVTELLLYLVEGSDVLRMESEALLAGIVMDTKNFTMRTGTRTFEAAAFLRRAGADTTVVKRLLQNDLGDTLARYSIIQKAEEYRKGVVIAAPDRAQNRVIAAQAADELLTIQGIEASFVMYPDGEGGVNISARSIGDVNVQVVLEKLGGGGNRSTAGAQVPNNTVKEAVLKLRAVIDEYLEPDEE